MSLKKVNIDLEIGGGLIAKDGGKPLEFYSTDGGKTLLSSNGSLYIDSNGNIEANTNNTPQEFEFTGSQIFTVSQPEITNVNWIDCVERDKEDATKESLPQKVHKLQYNFIPPNKIEITDELEVGDKIIINYQHFIIQP